MQFLDKEELFSLSDDSMTVDLHLQSRRRVLVQYSPPPPPFEKYLKIEYK